MPFYQVGGATKKQVKATPRYFYGGRPSQAQRDILLPGDMPPGSHFFRPTFALRWGRRGRGKTLTLVAEGHHFNVAYARRGLKTGRYPWQVLANFQNSHADITHPYLVELLSEYPPWGWNKRLEIDELAMYAHRRKWQLNLNLESFITQIRKRSIEPSAATQFPQRLDNDIVEQVDLFIDCDLEINGCGHPEHTFCAAQRVHDWWGQWSGGTWRKPWPPNPWDYDEFKWFHNTAAFFGSYVTEEIHSPVWWKDEQKQNIRLRQWGQETDLEADTEKFRRLEDLTKEHQPINEEIATEMTDWETYEPDLTIGAPGSDQLAQFLRDKASHQPGQLLTLNLFVKEAQNIDPDISSLRALSDFCRKQGWHTERDPRTGTNVAYIP